MRWSAVAIGAVLTVAVAACGGDETTTPVSGTPPTGVTTAPAASATTVAPTTPSVQRSYDQYRAFEIAHDAMISSSDLPGGWRAAQVDIAEVDSPIGWPAEPLPYLPPACQDMNRALSAHADLVDGDWRATARVQLSHPSGYAPTPGIVDVGVTIFGGTEAPNQALADREQSLESFTDCFGELLLTRRQQADEPPATFVVAAPAAVTPNGGLARAWDLTVPAGGFVFPMRLEVYAWVDGNALVEIAIFGTTEVITADLVRQAVAATEEKLAQQAN